MATKTTTTSTSSKTTEDVKPLVRKPRKTAPANPRKTGNPAQDRANTAKRTTPKATPAPKAPAKKATPAKATTTPAPKGHPGPAWRKAMFDAGMSQAKTAEAMGVSGMTINRIFNGHGIPTAALTVKFAKAIGADVETMWAEVAAYELKVARNGK